MQWSLNGCRNKEKIGKTAVGFDDLHLRNTAANFLKKEEAQKISLEDFLYPISKLQKDGASITKSIR